MDKSSLGRNKFRLGFDPISTQVTKAPTSRLNYNKYFFKEFELGKSNHASSYINLDTSKNSSTLQKWIIKDKSPKITTYLKHPVMLYLQKKWMSRDILKNYKELKNINSLGPKNVWELKDLLISIGNQNIKRLFDNE